MKKKKRKTLELMYPNIQFYRVTHWGIFYPPISEKDREEIVNKDPSVLAMTDTYGKTILTYKEIEQKFKDLAIEKYPEILKMSANFILFGEGCAPYLDLLADKYPEMLGTLDSYGRTILSYRNITERVKDIFIANKPEVLQPSILWECGVLRKYKEIVFEKFQETFRNTPGFLFKSGVDMEYKERLAEKFPELLFQLDNEKRNILFYGNFSEFLKDALLAKQPEALFQLDAWGQTILFYGEVQTKYLDLLLERNPEALTQVDIEGKNILYSYNAESKYKRLLVEKFPEAIAQDFLFQDSIDDEFKELLVERNPEALTQVDDEGKNILFYNNVDDEFKELLIEKHPEALALVDYNGRNILSYDVDDKYKDLLIEKYPSSLLVEGIPKMYEALAAKERANPSRAIIKAPKDETCPICLDDIFAGEDVLRIRCGHFLHEGCEKIGNYRCFCKKKF